MATCWAHERKESQTPKIVQDRGGPNSGELKTVGANPNQPITEEKKSQREPRF